MYKEMIISIILVVLIFIGDFITQNYTKKIVSSCTDELESLKQSLIDNDTENAEKKVDETDGIIKGLHDKMAYYIEHNEIEKLETNFTACKSFIKTGNYDLAISKLETTVFVLDHITDKYSFSLENIF